MNPRAKFGDLHFLLRLLDESFSKKTWHGPNLRGSLRGISVEEALWRPSADRHNIWEIMIHCAYWKYVVRKRILGIGKKGAFPLKGRNWFSSPGNLTPGMLRRDIRLLVSTHQAMVETITSLDPKDLVTIPKNSKVSNEAMIRGIALHDVYHAGQIQLLKKLRR